VSGEPVRYSARVRDLFARLPGAQAPAPGPGTLVSGEAMALDRGAWVWFEARLDQGRVAECVFRAWGCPHVLAASALACELVQGLAIDAPDAIHARRLAEALDAPAAKMGRLLVVEDAMRALFAGARRVQLP
jgi:NifU-like protein involved in Fe-S cluster formation